MTAHPGAPLRVRTRTSLARLLASRLDLGADAARRKLELLAALDATRLPGARAVVALHDHLLFLAAYPDDARVAG
ncbi:MAG: hypothetical protein F9K18_07435, partial [Thermoanaerobaculia bacterium]